MTDQAETLGFSGDLEQRLSFRGSTGENDKAIPSRVEPSAKRLKLDYEKHPADDILRTTEDLFEAAEKGHLSVVSSLLRDGVDANSTDHRGLTALHAAAFGGHEKVAELLLKHNADVNAGNSSSGLTPLHRAAFQGHEAVVVLLINHGANVNAKTQTNTTALIFAARRGHESVVKYLLAHEDMTVSNINAIDSTGFSALYQSAHDGHIGTMRLLVKYNPVLEKPPKNSSSILELAVKLQDDVSVSMMLENGVDPQEALDSAIGVRRLDYVQMMVKHGANIANIEERLRNAARSQNKVLFRTLLKLKEGIE